MFALERGPAGGRARRLALLVGPLLVLAAACSSTSTDAGKTKVASELVTSSAALRGSGPGEACHPASAPATRGEPTPVVPSPAPNHLLVTDLKVGTGPPAQVGQVVTVQYLGVACSTGTQFDATWDRGRPYTTRLSSPPLMSGWVRGIEGMRVGGLRQLVVPPALGYGNEGYHKLIRPGETLVYVIQLQAIH